MSSEVSGVGDRNPSHEIDLVLEVMDGFLASAVLCAALENGLFWLLEEAPMEPNAIATELGIPLTRCKYWLQYLAKLGYLDFDSDEYDLTDRARTSILDAYSRQTWSLLAQETRERYPLVQWLPTHIQESGSLWNIGGYEPPNYIDQMHADPQRASRFTRMLYEIHKELAEQVAIRLDLGGVTRMMDLGGGSGGISSALLKKHDHLKVLVVDIPNVCSAGEELASAAGINERLQFHPADFMKEDLPRGFDLVLECDVGVYNKRIFENVHLALRPGGRFIIIDQFGLEPEIVPSPRLDWAILGSLQNPTYQYPHVDEVVRLLKECGFIGIRSEPINFIHAKAHSFNDGMVMLEARVGPSSS